VNKIKWWLFLPFLLLASSLACSTATKYLPPAVTILAAPAESATWDAASFQKASEIIAERLKEKASGKFSVQVTGANQISVALYAAKDLDVTQKLITEPGLVVFADTEKIYSPGDEFETPKEVILTQADIQTASSMESQADGQAEVSFILNPAGAKKLANYTRENVGHFLAIVRDGRVVSCPRINGEILGGRGIIAGVFNPQEADELAAVLTHPPLPFPLVIVKIDPPKK
jgi:preprotein translocase subunit SecD